MMIVSTAAGASRCFGQQLLLLLLLLRDEMAISGAE